MNESKPICSLSLDLDNQWSYMKTHGDPGWDCFPSYLDLVVPRFLEILDNLGWKITVFVVGQDAVLEKNREALQMIAAAGHEIGNHSFNHEPWLHLYSRSEIRNEIIRAEDAIEAATGQRPRGFRGPGYSISRDVLEVLTERDYLYDASTLPTFIGPLARVYYFMTSDLSAEEKRKRMRLFGGFRDGLQPIAPYNWELGDRRLLEIPVTTMPALRLPIHFSYLLYISTFSTTLARLYFRVALSLCRVANVHPSLLLHPLDFLGSSDVPALEFFPAMRCPPSEKLSRLASAFETLRSRYSVAGMAYFAARTSEQPPLPLRPPPPRNGDDVTTAGRKIDAARHVTRRK
jgi:hypothetical protein